MADTPTIASYPGLVDVTIQLTKTHPERRSLIALNPDGYEKWKRLRFGMPEGFPMRVDRGVIGPLGEANFTEHANFGTTEDNIIVLVSGGRTKQTLVSRIMNCEVGNLNADTPAAATAIPCTYNTGRPERIKFALTGSLLNGGGDYSLPFDSLGGCVFIVYLSTTPAGDPERLAWVYCSMTEAVVGEEGYYYAYLGGDPEEVNGDPVVVAPLWRLRVGTGIIFESFTLYPVAFIPLGVSVEYSRFQVRHGGMLTAACHNPSESDNVDVEIATCRVDQDQDPYD